MNLQQMYYVKKIAETKSINKASKLLNISQPALTKQLKLLEEELATTLFVRNKSGCILTRDGEFFLQEVDIILNKVSSIKHKFTEKEAEKIKIAALPSIASNLLPKIIQKLSYLNYKINIQVVGTTQEIEYLLSEGEIDVGFGQDLEENDYVFTLLNEPYFVIVQNTSRLSQVNSISLEELTNQNLILPTFSCDIRKSLDQFLNQEDITLMKNMEIGQNDLILTLVKNGVGLTILPEMMLSSIDGNLKPISINNKGFRRNISLLTYSSKLLNLIKVCMNC